MCKAAFDFCEETAKRFDATAPALPGAAGASGVSAAPPQPVALEGEIVCTRSDAAAPPGKVFFTAPVEWRDEMYAGCVISAHAAVLGTRLEFTVPSENSFRLKLGLPPTLTATSFPLSDLKITSGAKAQSAAPAAEAETASP